MNRTKVPMKKMKALAVFQKTFELMIFPIIIENSVAVAQNESLILRNMDSGKYIILPQFKEITIFKSNDSLTAYFEKHTGDYLYLLRYDRDSNAIESRYVSRGKDLDEMLKKNWREHEASRHGYSDMPDRQEFSPRAHIYRSTDIDSVALADIDVIQFRKVEKARGGTIGMVLLPLAAITSPLWARDEDGKYDWRATVVLAGLTTWLSLAVTINAKRSQNKKYTMTEWEMVDW